MWIDTHCHLDAAEFAADRSAVIAAALSAGVDSLLVPAVSVAQFAAMRDVCRASTAAGLRCWPAYGIHPLYVGQSGPDDLATLRTWLQAEIPSATGCIAVGEIGLDGYVADADPAQQEACFVAQLKLAQEFELPVLLHVRRAVDRVLKHLRHIRVRGGIAHAFNGSRQQADEFIKLGFKLGFGGTLTYSGSTRIRALARELPLEAIVLETDAPDIAPAFAPARSEPAFVARYGAELAALRGLSADAVASASRANLRALWPNRL